MKRYRVVAIECHGELQESAEGEWVRAEDVERAMADILDWYQRAERGEVNSYAALVSMRCRAEMVLEQLRGTVSP